MSKKADIARKFDLPERQSKLATMLREEGLKDEQVYCICRSTDVSRFMIGCDRCEEWYHGDCINVTEQQANTIRKFYCRKCQQKNSSLTIKYKISKSHDSDHHSDRKHSHHKKSEKKRTRCGECEACYVKEDCGRCQPCKDRLGQKCKKRQCINFYHLAKKNKDHGRSDHTYISSSKSSSSKKCVMVTPARPTEAKPIVVAKPKEVALPPPPQVQIWKPEEPVVAPETRPKKTSYERDAEWVPGVLRNRNSDEEILEPKRRKNIHKESKNQKKNESKAGRKRKVRKDSSSDSDDSKNELLFDSKPRQCFGPQCGEAARSGSKYCSDKCGLKLAEARIYSVLPQRIQEWHLKPCVSSERDSKKLEKFREQQQTAKDELRNLDEKHRQLDALMERVKAIPPIPEGEAEEEESEYAFVYCVTCGHEVDSRKALRHMHHCYNKLESQMSFGSMYKTRIEGNNMFCDFYNTATMTYCKRLRVMCPEHVKDPKVSSTEVCGFPLVEDLFKETNDVCRVPKKTCTRHYLWEKLRRATIDMERVRQCLKLDELVEQERSTITAMTNRAGVLGLMLHSTYNHPLLDKFQKHRQMSQGSSNPNQRVERECKPTTATVQRNNSYSGSSSAKHKYEKSTISVRVDTPKQGVKVQEQKSDHPYYRHPFNPDKPKPRIIKANVRGSQKYVVDQGGDIEVNIKRTHDHLYSSSNTPLEVKRHQDHMYYTNKRFK